jgi:dipeptidyl aminopeptidase/acylaminoacyl peptidase
MKDYPGIRASLASYMSGNLRIRAWLYEPPADRVPQSTSTLPIDTPPPPGAALILGHGGTGGIPAHYDLVLRRMAYAGWTIAVPSYRGEDGSDGEIEFALGEADDMLECLKAAMELPNVDPRKTWFLGSSHGSMASLGALSRDSLPREAPGAVACYGVYDVGEWLDWMERVDNPVLGDPGLSPILKFNAQELQTRSAVSFAGRIKGSVLLVHGTQDFMVSHSQSEEMAAAFEASGKKEFQLLLVPGADHEFIWGPDRKEAISAWKAIIEFMTA